MTTDPVPSLTPEGRAKLDEEIAKADSALKEAAEGTNIFEMACVDFFSVEKLRSVAEARPGVKAYKKDGKLYEAKASLEIMHEINQALKNRYLSADDVTNITEMPYYYTVFISRRLGKRHTPVSTCKGCGARWELEGPTSCATCPVEPEKCKGSYQNQRCHATLWRYVTDYDSAYNQLGRRYS